MLEGNIHGSLEFEGGVGFTDVMKHKGGCQNGGGWVGDTASRNVWCATMNALEDGVLFANVAAGSNPQATNQTCGQVRDDVPESVSRYNHIKALWACNKLHGAVVNNNILNIDACNFGSRVPGSV